MKEWRACHDDNFFKRERDIHINIAQVNEKNALCFYDYKEC